MNRFALPAVLAIACLLNLDAVGAAKAAEPAARQAKQSQTDSSGRFLRVRRADDGAVLALETSIVSYQPSGDDPKGLEIDLIGAVHIGDAEYFERLNRQFASYDALLYELVAPEDANIPAAGGRHGGHPVSTLQLTMKSLLELEFQLDEIDYTKKNFVHADMSPDEFTESMRRRGESFAQLYFRMIGQSMSKTSSRGKKAGERSDDAQPGDDKSRASASSVVFNELLDTETGRSALAAVNDMRFLMNLFSKDRALLLKRELAVQFEDLEVTMYALEGPNGTTLIKMRNQKAFDVLAREIKAGKRRIGIFYGAGHMPDMERRLIDDMGMKRAGIRWVTAWSMDPAQPK